MEVKLSVELPVHTFELPVPDFPSRPIASDAVSSVSQESISPEVFASEAGVFHGSKLSLGWRISGASSSFEVSPLELDARRLPRSGARIRLVSPFPILANCAAISEGDNQLVVDFVSILGTLHTVLIPYSWLLEPQTAYPAMPEMNVSRPFSFDLVAPRLMKAVNQNLLILSLVDGSLIRLDRTTPLSRVTHLTLEDAGEANVVTSFAKFFKGSKDKVPGHPSLSLTSAVSLAILQPDYCVTYAINHTIRLWSLRSNTCVQVIDLGIDAPLRMRVSKYLSSHENQVAIALPQSIKVFKFDKKSENLTEQSSLSSAIPSAVHSWYLTSLSLLGDGKVIAAFKLNISAQIYLVDGQKWRSVGGYDYSQSLELPTNASIAAIKSRISELPSSIVTLALAQNALHTGHKIETIDHGSQTVEVLSSIIPQSSSPRSHTEWLRLDTFCRQLNAQAAELLTLAPALSIDSGLFFWMLHVSGESILSVNTTTEADKADESAGVAEQEALEIAQDLLGSVPDDTMSRISDVLLSSSLVMERMDTVCGIMRQHLDQLKLNETGRKLNLGVASAIRKYIETYGVAGNFFANVEDSHDEDAVSPLTQLSKLGRSAVESLVYDFSVDQAAKFQWIASLAVIALVEGWLSNGDDADLLAASIKCLRQFTIFGELGLSKLNLDVSSAHLETFGSKLARQIIASADIPTMLCKQLPPATNSFSPQDLDDFERILNFCEASAEVTLLKSLAALTVSQESAGIALAQQVSLSRVWLSTLGKRPATQSGWFLAVAKYAENVHAKQAAFWLAQYGESLASPDDEAASELLLYLFKLSIDSGDITVAYTALCRWHRLNSHVTNCTSGIESMIKDLITAAARKGIEEAKTLVVSYPFIGLASTLQKTLTNTTSFAAVPAYKLRYAWHVEREDYVGAAQVIYNHITAEKNIEAIRKAELYTVCLNALSLVDTDSRWLSCGEQVLTFDDIKIEQKHILDAMTASI